MQKILTDDFKNAPYWWDAAPPQGIAPSPLAPAYDVAIVGAGYTGLHAALVLLRGGRSVAVFEKELAGSGASRRNAGFLGRVLKKSYSELARSNGVEHARAVYEELDAALQTTFLFIESERIACHANRCGRFIAANSPAHYAELEQELDVMRRELGLPYWMVQKSAQHEEVATEQYHGGAVIPDLGSLHPGLYHRGLLDLVLRAGGCVHDGTEVLEIRRVEGKGFRVRTSRGEITARDVVVATNGYTPRQLRWYARRVIPFTGYMAATEPLPPELLARLIPHRRTVLDTKLNIDFFRPAPDQPRLLFGGHTGSGLTTVEEIATRLHALLRLVFPELGDVKLSHVWSGECAGTFDMMPHLGQHDGMWYGMGYNYAGVPMGSYFGVKIGQRLLGRANSRSVFEEGPFPTLPLYSGNPWFVPLVMRFFDWKDHRKARKSLRNAP